MVNDMKNKGFTLVELITTFALAAIIIIFLMNIIVIVKNIYSKSEIKSNLLVEQSTLSSVINKKIYNSGFDSYESCGEGCYTISYKDGTTSTLNIGLNSISFDNYVYKAIDGVTIETPTVEINYSFFRIVIPIKHRLYSNIDFGVDILHIID